MPRCRVDLGTLTLRTTARIDLEPTPFRSRLFLFADKPKAPSRPWDGAEVHKAVGRSGCSLVPGYTPGGKVGKAPGAVKHRQPLEGPTEALEWGPARGRNQPTSVPSKSLSYNGLDGSSVLILTVPRQWAKYPFPSPTPTCPPLPDRARKKIRSPDRGRARGPRAAEASICSVVSRGKATPCSPSSSWAKAEQSRPAGVRPPHR